jgi:hypothetical protein
MDEVGSGGRPRCPSQGPSTIVGDARRAAAGSAAASCAVLAARDRVEAAERWPCQHGEEAAGTFHGRDGAQATRPAMYKTGRRGGSLYC